jgi:hypothetical protein
MRRVQINNNVARTFPYAVTTGRARGIIDFNKPVRMRNGLVRTDFDAFQARYAADRADCAHDRALVAGTAGNMCAR